MPDYADFIASRTGLDAAAADEIRARMAAGAKAVAQMDAAATAPRPSTPDLPDLPGLYSALDSASNIEPSPPGTLTDRIAAVLHDRHDCVCDDRLTCLGGRRDAAVVVAMLEAEGRLLSDAEIEQRRETAEQMPRTPPRIAARTLEELHAGYMHPDWEYATTEGPRKGWADYDVPPEGDGWERNILAGRAGWDRFEYTEQSYWMRPKPGGTDA